MAGQHFILSHHTRYYNENYNCMADRHLIIIVLQADISLFLITHGISRPGRVINHVFSDQSDLRVNRDRRSHNSCRCFTSPLPRDFVGLHQSGPHLSPSTQISPASRQSQRSHQILETSGNPFLKTYCCSFNFHTLQI